MTQPKKKQGKADNGAKPLAAYFLSLTVENVRCFGPKQTLDLSDGHGRPARWTIILGDNGTGKTTLLKSLIAIVPMQIADHDNSNRPITKFVPQVVAADKIKVGLDTLKKNVAPLAQIDDGIYVNAYPGFRTYGEFNVQTNLSSDKPVNQIVSRFAWFANGAFTFNEIDKSFDWNKFIILGYGAKRRMSDTSVLSSDSVTSAGLSFNNTELLNAEEWFLQNDYAARIPSEIQPKAIARRDLVKDVLIDLLPDVEDIRIAYLSNEQPKPRVEFKTAGGWVGIGSISLGYQTLTAWMVDFAARMFEAYPDSANPLAEPAVVLIDEIDLHLHPRWQRDLISRLTELFPNTQFIATTHSPLVVQAAADANLVVLRREGDHVVIDNDVEAVRGWRADQILTSELFDLPSARPPDYEKPLAERQKILGKSRLTKADRQRLAELEAEIGNLPAGETLADDKAMDIIRRAAARLEQQGV